MSEPIKFVPPRVALTDPATGLITREWFLFFQAVFIRIGGANGESNTELVASAFEDAGIEETKALLFAQAQQFGQLPPPVDQTTMLVEQPDQRPAPYSDPVVEQLTQQLASLQDQLAEVLKEVQALKQSTLI